MIEPTYPRRTPSSQRRPSRIKLAAIWFALLLGSFLFGMLIISPLLGAFLSNRDTGPESAKPKPAAAQRPRTSHITGPSPSERITPRQPALGAGISLSPDESDSVVEAADRVDVPTDGIHTPPPQDPAVQPDSESAADPGPNPAPPTSTPSGEIQRPETID